MDKKRLLVVEDEDHLLDGLQLNFVLEGYEVTAARSGNDALKEFRKGRFDLVLLDVMIPDINGFDVCQTIRLEDSHTPILFLSARGSTEDRIKGLKTGADDYIVKPFNLEELLLKVKILLSRSEGKSVSSNTDTYTIGDASIDFKSYEVVRGDDKLYDLSQKEAKLLRLLIDKKDEVVSRDYILETIWGFDVYPTTRTIDNYILTYRKLFEMDSRQPKHFHSIRGVGYKFTD